MCMGHIYTLCVCDIHRLCVVGIYTLCGSGAHTLCVRDIYTLSDIYTLHIDIQYVYFTMVTVWKSDQDLYSQNQVFMCMNTCICVCMVHMCIEKIFMVYVCVCMVYMCMHTCNIQWICTYACIVHIDKPRI